MSKLDDQATALYAKFTEDSTQEQVGDDVYSVWRGKLVETCLELGIPYGSYRKVVKALANIGAIEIKSGNRGTPTTVTLLSEPTADALASEILSRPLTEALESAKVLADARTLLDSLGGINVGKALVNIERRLTAIESKIKEGGLANGKDKRSTKNQ